MIPMPDPDCNQVLPGLDQTPGVSFSYRCTAPEGHDGAHRPLTLMRHKHRAPVKTVTTPFGNTGGKHRAHVGAASGPNRVDSELRRRLALSTGGAR